MSVDLSVRLGRLVLKNPIATASGTFGYGLEFAEFLPLGKLGGISVKGLSLRPCFGNPPPRICETDAGMLNAIGLQNVGVEAFLSEKLPELERLGATVIANVWGDAEDDYVAVVERIGGDRRVAAIELNVSCPNVVKGGLIFGNNPTALGALVRRVRGVTPLPLIVKLSPNVTDITATARAAIDAGADCLSLINTFVGMAIDIERQRPILANRTGGLSGPAIKPLALNLVNRVYREVAGPAKVPLIGMGGVRTWSDAVEFMLAGAAAVGIGTAMFIDPTTPIKVLEGLETYLRRHHLTSAGQLVGRLRFTRDECPAG